MLQILDIKNTVPFMKYRGLARWFSLALIAACLVSIGVKGFNWGLDFTGGTLIEARFERAAQLDKLRVALDQANYKDAVVQNFGSAQEVVVRVAPVAGATPEQAAKQAEAVQQVMRNAVDDTMEVRSVSFVGPNIGDEFREAGGLATLAALICILLYVSIRFEWRLAVGSVAALAHDVILTLGLFSFLGLQFDMTVLAAILAVIGYSLNDTIVVMDRIRENFRKIRKSEVEEIIDISLSQTFSRTVVTSLTTILVLIALFVWGGPTIHGFATAMLFGVFVGTYSSIYVASTVAMGLNISREDLLPTEVEKEGADQEALL